MLRLIRLPGSLPPPGSTTALPYDPLRTPDASGYIKRFMPLDPHAEQLPCRRRTELGRIPVCPQAERRATTSTESARGRTGSRSTSGIDHNFNAMHRVSGTYSYEKDNAEDAFPTMPQNSWGGAVLRNPQSFARQLRVHAEADAAQRSARGLDPYTIPHL